MMMKTKNKVHEWMDGLNILETFAQETLVFLCGHCCLIDLNGL